MKRKIPKIKISGFKLTGKRIILRPLKFSDAKDIYSNIKDKRIAENTIRTPWPYKLEDAQKFIRKMQRAWKKGKSFAFGIESRDKKEVIGCIILYDVDFKNKNTEISYWLGPKYRNQGIMTEGVKLVLNFAFRKLKLHRVWAKVFSDNPVSQEVLKRVGFKKEGYHRESTWHFGRWRNDVPYALLVEEFFKK